MNDDNNQTAASLDDYQNGHQVTDDNGELSEEPTSIETSAPQEGNTEEEIATAEKPAAPESEAPKAPSQEAETELAVDDAGKRYVPESRFKEIYGKFKELERKQQTPKPSQPIIPPVSMSKTDVLETDLLYVALPQFNPDSESYDRDLDEMAADIFGASKVIDPLTGQIVPSISKVEAGRRAIDRQKKLTRNHAQIVAEARQVKTQQADQGITTRATSRQDSTPDVDKMTDQELEAYLKSTGQW